MRLTTTRIDRPRAPIGGRLLLSAALLSLASACGSRPEVARHPARINLSVGHEAPELAESHPIVVTVTAAHEIEIGGQVRSCRLEDREALRADLARLSKDTPEDDRALLVRADASVPYGAMQAVIDASSRVGIRRCLLEVAPGADGSRRAFQAEMPPSFRRPGLDTDGRLVDDADLPCNTGVLDDPRIGLSQSPATGSLERFLGPLLIASGQAGDESIEASLRTFGRQLDERSAPRRAVIVDCGARVPWQHVIEVASIARRADWPLIELGSGIELEEVQPSGAETR